MFSRLGVFGVCLLALVGALGCGGGSSNSTPPPTIAISLTGAPQTLATSGTVQLTATVTNDSASKGADWSCAPAASCGSFSPAHTASGQATTYTAPTAAGTVTITVASTTSPTTTATAMITITAAQQISVAITGAPASLAVNATAQLTGTVTNDSTNAGVDWSCIPANTCGSFNPTHTASGSATTYTAPAAATAVTVTAASTAQATATATASINVTAATAGATLAAGNYVLDLIGTEATGFTYALAGSITVDGNGNVTAGEQDYNDGHGILSPAGGDKITGGTYTIGTGGIGKLSLVTNNAALGTGGTENFSITVVNSKHVLLTQTDASGTAGGTLDFQTPNSTMAGNYSFFMAGAANGSEQEVFGGLIQVTGAGTIHVNVDVNADGNNNLDGTNTGTFTAPDAQGRATMAFGGDNYAVYIIGPEVLRLIIVDSNRQDTGSAYGQGSGPFSAASLSGSFVFKLNSAGSSAAGAASFASAGQFTTNGTGTVTAGFADSDAAGTIKSSTFTGTYTLGTAVAGVGYGNAALTSPGILGGSFGVYAVDPNLNILDPNNTTGGGGALLISLTAGSPGYGVILPQAAPASSNFSGNYAVDWRCFTPGGVEQNADGQANVATGLVLAGTVDAADLQANSPHLGVAISGTATADPANPGRFTLPLTVALTPTSPALTFVVYQASTGDLVWVETDTTQYVSGTIEQQQ
jgi:hypothetical protein